MHVMKSRNKKYDYANSIKNWNQMKLYYPNNEAKNSRNYLIDSQMANIFISNDVFVIASPETT